MSSKSYYLVANITGKQKKDNQQAPKTLVLGFYLDLCNCPTLKNTLSEKTVQIQFFGNKFRSIQRILKVSGFIDSVSKCAMFYAKKDEISQIFNWKNEKNCKMSVWDIVQKPLEHSLYEKTSLTKVETKLC